MRPGHEILPIEHATVPFELLEVLLFDAGNHVAHDHRLHPSMSMFNFSSISFPHQLFLVLALDVRTYSIASETFFRHRRNHNLTLTGTMRVFHAFL
jgi:hypothetical protein